MSLQNLMVVICDLGEYLCIDEKACLLLISRLKLVDPIVEPYDFQKHSKFVLKLK